MLRTASYNLKNAVYLRHNRNCGIIGGQDDKRRRH